MSRDIIDELIEMRDRISARIEEEEARHAKLQEAISADEARLVMADALALLAKGRFHSDHAGQVAAVRDRLRKQLRGAA